jgi:hypothetical protein
VTDPNAVAGYRRALARRGQQVIVRRISGDAPNAVTFDARVAAIVMDYQPKQPVSEIKPEGGITLGARNVIVLTADLVAARFPLPVTKNDKVVTNPSAALLGRGTAAGDEELNIIAVDPYKRGIAGAIDIVAEGV